MAIMRLLICGHCKTVEELPDYDGPVEYDTLLDHLVSRHKYPNGEGHAPASLGNVPDAQWAIPEVQNQTIAQIKATFSGAETGLGSEFYELRDTFTEDALLCFDQHLRNPGCGDYKSDGKRLTSDSQREIRKEFKVDINANPMNQRYLCEWCPVHSLVQQAARRKAGLDK